MSEPTPNLPATRGDLVASEPPGFDSDDLEALKRAVRALEHQSFTMKIANVIGRQLGNVARLLPGPVSSLVDKAAEKALQRAMAFALDSLGKSAPPRDTRRLHKAAATMSGAAGGVFGVSSLPVELPISTIIILRSIADIARNEGEDLSDPDVAMACLAVFALGASDRAGKYAESEYFGMRVMLANAVKEATSHIAKGMAPDAAAPVLVRLISQIGTRFGIVVSEKLAAQAVPILGAAGGAAINYAFAEHFQSLAWAHFTVRRLERLYGAGPVRAAYDRLLDEAAPSYA